MYTDRGCRKHGRLKCNNRRCKVKLHGDCWVCGGTGRVSKHGCSKSVACSECGGTGGMRLERLLRQMDADAQALTP